MLFAWGLFISIRQTKLNAHSIHTFSIYPIYVYTTKSIFVPLIATYWFEHVVKAENRNFLMIVWKLSYIIISSYVCNLFTSTSNAAQSSRLNADNIFSVEVLTYMESIKLMMFAIWKTHIACVENLIELEYATKFIYSIHTYILCILLVFDCL